MQMFQHRFQRFLHTGLFLANAKKSPLAKLRKKTGYSISNCKKALELNNNELAQAEKWLQEEAQKQGWAKAAKFQNRVANQGLIGLHIQTQTAAIVEVSCETDFVSRNDHFKELVKTVANTCHKQISNHLQTESNELTKCEISSSELGQLSWEQKTLSDRVALAISHLGENIVLKRATIWQASGDMNIGGAVHPSQAQSLESLIGSYGAIVAYKRNGNAESAASAANQLSVHIIGMNPKLLTRQVNEEEEVPVAATQPPKATTVEENVSVEDLEDADSFVEDTKDEPALLLQKFIFNDSITVKEYLDDQKIQVVDFLRFECAEIKDSVAD